MKKDITKALNIKLNRLIELIANVKKLDLPFEVDHVLATPAVLIPDLHDDIFKLYRSTLDESVSDAQVNTLTEALYQIVGLSRECVLYSGRVITHSSQRLTKAGYQINGVCERHGDRYASLYFQLPFGRIYFHVDTDIISNLVDAANWLVFDDEEDEAVEVETQSPVLATEFTDNVSFDTGLPVDDTSVNTEANAADIEQRLNATTTIDHSDDVKPISVVDYMAKPTDKGVKGFIKRFFGSFRLRGV